MTITVLVLALVAALVIVVVGALLFTAAAVGFALLILLPVLFITTFAGAFIWLWGIGAYYILKWFNKKEIPGVHTSMEDGVMGDGGPLGDLKGLTGKGPPPDQEKSESPLDKKHDAKPNGTAKQNGAAKKGPVGDKLDGVGKATGVDVPDVKNATDVGKNAGKVANPGELGKKADLGKVKGVTGGVL